VIIEAPPSATTMSNSTSRLFSVVPLPLRGAASGLCGSIYSKAPDVFGIEGVEKPSSLSASIYATIKVPSVRRKSPVLSEVIDSLQERAAKIVGSAPSQVGCSTNVPSTL
jgi:hypothetical protein